MRKEILLPLVLVGSIILGASNAYGNSFGIELFPKNPVSTTILSDPFNPKTQFKAPLIKNPGNYFSQNIRDLSRYTTVGRILPLLSVGAIDTQQNATLPRIGADPKTEGKKITTEQTVLGTLIASGQLNPYISKSSADFDANIELFLTSPVINALYSFNPDGSNNPLYLVAGFNQKGSINFSGIEKKTLPQAFSPSTVSLEENSFFGDIYIIGRSPYSKQYTILKAGVHDLFSSSGKKPNFDLSMAMEFPSIIPFIKSISPYLTASVDLTGKGVSEAIGQIGAKIGSSDSKAVYIFLEADYIKGSKEGWESYLGLKTNLFN